MAGSKRGLFFIYTRQRKSNKWLEPEPNFLVDLLVRPLEHSEISLSFLVTLKPFFLDFFFPLITASFNTGGCLHHPNNNKRGCRTAVCHSSRRDWEQLSPARAAQAVRPAQACCEAYLQVFVPKQTARRCRDIYSPVSICFTNIDKEWLVWQRYLAGNFGFARHTPL